MLDRTENRSMSNAKITPSPLTVVLGGTGGVGAALAGALQARGETVLAIGRCTDPAIDYTQPESVAACAQWVADRLAQRGETLARLIVATGFLHGE
ncbi:MAG: nucleoside-diphosphate-sugar epimerase, partial [Hydrogenophaga sp.]